MDHSIKINISTMKRNVITSFFIVLLVFNAKSQQPQTAIEMNNILVSVIDSLHEAGTSWTNRYQTVSKTKEYALLASNREEIIILIDRLSNGISLLQDIGGSEEFRKAIIEFLSFERSLVADYMGSFERLNATSSEDEINGLFSKLNEITTTEKEKLWDINAIQAAYAYKNGFTIDSKDSDDEDDDDYDPDIGY